MRVIPLGISSGVPTATRGVSAVAVDLERLWILLDCGEGTQQRLIHSGLRLAKLGSIFITHLHGDHLFGLPGLLGTLNLRGRTEPLRVFGPIGIREFVEAAFGVSGSRLDYPVTIHEIEKGDPPGKWLLETFVYCVRCEPLEHRVVAYGYRVESRIHSRLRASLAYCTDTVPCEGSVRLANRADLLIHEATYAEALSALAAERGHSTAMGAARVARAAKARRLMLTHFSPRYQDPSILVDEAREVFPDTIAARELVPTPLPQARADRVRPLSA